MNNSSHVQLAISAAMDGDARAMTPDVRDHLQTCDACRRFAKDAQRIRVGARLQIAEPVPDLTGQIMASVREEAVLQSQHERRPNRVPRRSFGRRFPVRARSLAAAAAIGALVGAVAVSGGLVPTNRPGALAESIPHQIAEAAHNLDAYQATFRIVEHNWSPQVPRRTFNVDVAFAATEQFRVDVHDTTTYPATGYWPSNDSKLVVNGSRWSLEGPDVCIPAETTPCPAAGSAPSAGTTPASAPTFRHTITGRPPFDADAPMPTDIVLPMTSLAGSDRVDVIGQGTVAGRPAVEVAVSAQDAAPLFAFFQQAGSWRPIYPSDRVTLWLDRENWFPLSAQVTAAGGQDRAAWAARNGITREPAGAPVLDFTVSSLSHATPPPAKFAVNGRGTDEGFREATGAALASAVGYEPLRPLKLQGLAPARDGYFADAPHEAVLSYANGLSWVRIRQTEDWPGPSLFGNVDAFAQRVALPGQEGGVGYFEPATPDAGRRVAIHTANADFFVESNLPRNQLLALAGSIPARGLEIPESWQTQRFPGGVVVRRLSLADVVTRATFPVLVPSPAPVGYQLTAAQLATYNPGSGATLFYARSGTEPGGFGIRIYQSPGEVIPPASGTALSQVQVRGVSGRWSPDEHQLEWVESGVYRSITAPGLELGQIISLANSLAGPA